MQYYYLAQEEYKPVDAVIKITDPLIINTFIISTRPILYYRSRQEEHNELKTGKRITI